MPDTPTMRPRRYSAAAVQVFVEPYRITGFKGDTPINIAPVTADDEHDVNTDMGGVTVYRSTDNRYIVSLDMDPESIGYRRLAELAREQRAADAGEIPAAAFRFHDPSNGDVFEDEHAIVISRPELSLGGGRDAVQVRILLPNPEGRLGGDL